MSAISPFTYYTSMGPTSNPGGFSSQSFGTPGLLNFGFPSYGDPLMYFAPAASSFFVNDWLAAANGSAVNINFGPKPSTLGLSNFLLGAPFFGSGGGGNVGGTAGPWGQSGWGNPFSQPPFGPFGGFPRPPAPGQFGTLA